MNLKIVLYISFVKRNFKILFSLLLIYLLIWIINFLTPELGDDYWYKFYFGPVLDESDDLITNLPSIISSQFNHYFIVNGRSFVHFFVQLFSGIFGKSIFNFINATIFTLFVYWLNKLNYRITAFNLVFIASLVFLLFPVPNETILWMTGSINYLWTSCFVCGFLLLLKKNINSTLTPINSLWLIPCLIIGWTHEGITMPLAGSLIIYLWVKKSTISKSANLYFIIAFIIGVFFCSFSPGTFNRINSSNANAVIMLLYRLQSVFIVSSKLIGVYVIICFAVIYLILLKRNYIKSLKNFYLNNLIILNAFIFSFGIIFISGFWYDRGAVGVALYSILLILKLINKLPGLLSKYFKIGFMVSGMIIYVLIIPYSILNFKQDKIVMSKIRNTQSNIIVYDDIEIPFFLDKFILKKINAENILITDYRNRYIARIYGLDNLRFIPKRIYNIIKEDQVESYQIKDQMNFPFYILKINNNNMDPYFILRKSNPNEIPFYCKPFAKKLLKYSADSIPCQNYEIFNINGLSYIVILKNDNIDFRLEDIKLNNY